jgi:ATP-dependent helicase IRC3
VAKSANVNDLKELKDKRVESVSPSPQPTGSDALSDNHQLDFTHYDSVHDLLEDTSGERHVRAISPNAWVQIDSYKYVLTAKGGILTLERRLPTSDESSVKPTSEATFLVIWKHSLPPTEKSKSPWSRPCTVATASTLSDALHSADTFAASKFERIFIVKSSPWRKSPASQGQIEFLNKLREVSEEEPLTEEDITKGQAGDMITKVKFGARGRFDKLMKVKRGVDKQIDKVRKVKEMRDRETVRVGPLEA